MRQTPRQPGNPLATRRICGWAGGYACGAQGLKLLTLGFRVACAMFFVVGATLMWGCGAGPQPTATPTAEPTASPTATQVPEPTATPAREPTATPQPEPAGVRQAQPAATPMPISPEVAEAITNVGASMVLIETNARAGSGILIEGGYILTSASIVWPYDTARVLLADGSGFSAVPLKGSDLLADLALLGPVDASQGGVSLASQERLGVGQDAFLIGFQVATQQFPQLTISPRAIAGIREFESTGITYLQTNSFMMSDAGEERHITGWVLVSTEGDVLGVVGFQPLRTNFEVASSAADVLPRVAQLIAGGDPSELGDRKIPVTEGSLSHEVALENFLAQRAFVLNEPAGTEVTIQLEGEDEGRLSASDSISRILAGEIKDSAEPAVSSFVLQTNDLHFATVWRLVDGPGNFVLTSSHPLIHLPDPDDGTGIPVGGSVRGNIDFPGDLDYFVFDLSEDETVMIRANSILIDTLLNVYPLMSDGRMNLDVGAETTLFKNESITVYRALEAGQHIAVVVRASNQAPGAYVLSVDPAEPELALTYTAIEERVRGPAAGSTPTP